MSHALANFVAFQLCWFANVLGAANAQPWLGPVVVALWLVAHVRACVGAREVEGYVCASVGLLGYVTDSALVLTGLIAFPAFTHLGGPSPLWMIALWVGFAMTLRHSLGWLRGRYLLGAALGAIFGPLAYFAGEKLGAISLIAGNASLLAVALQWSVALPLSLGVVAWLEMRAMATGKANLRRRGAQ